MTDDLFRSMKAQMQPTDDVVADLLAKIAAEASSPVTENENVIPFRESSRQKKHTQKKKKSILYYSTAVAACLVVFLSTVILLDSSGDPDDPNTIKNLLNQVVGSDSATDPNASTDDKEKSQSDKQDDEPGFWEQIFHGKDEEKDPADGSTDMTDGTNPSDSNENTADENNGKKGSEQHGQPSQDENQQPSNEPKDDPDDPSNTMQQPNGQKPGTTTQPTEPGNQPSSAQDNKVTPAAPGTSDIPWTNEIVNTSEVASINISGTNYVVDSTGTSSALGSTIETVTVDLPGTSSTKPAKVSAKVKTVKKVSAAAMVALDVEGFTQPLVYTNPNYSPSSLGALVSDLGLEGNTGFSNTVRCQVSHMGYSSNHTYKADVNSAAWNYLLNCSGAESAGYNSFNDGHIKVLFTSGSNPTGSQLKFGVSDNGYLYVSMTGGKRFTFHIGKSQAIGFIEAVTGQSIDALEG